MNKKVNKTKILIVGGGMTGLFAAWRLLSEIDPKPSVTLIEKMDRVGGRLETTFVNILDKNGNKQEVHDEDGGMRFVPEGTGMEHLWKLLNELRTKYALTPVKFEMGSDNNRYYIRGKSFTLKKAKKKKNKLWSKLYNLKPAEQNMDPSEILGEVMKDILTQNNKIDAPTSPAEWIKFRNTCTYKDYDDKPVVLNKWGFWAILRKYGLSEECIVMLSHVFGFMGPFEKYINAGEGLQILFDFPEPSNASFQTLAEGFEALPRALASEIKVLGGNIILKEAAVSVSKKGNTFHIEGKKDQYTADKVILAIPKKPMKKLIENSSLLASESKFLKAVDSVKNMELTKIGLYFSDRWWLSNKKIKLVNGPNFTDLPLGSVYTFSQFPTDDKNDKKYLGPAALTQYTDYTRGNFWKELYNIGEMYQTDEFPENPSGTRPASRALVIEMMKQIKLLFGLKENDDVPMPVLSTYRVWGQDNYGYGYHQYKINIDDSKEVYPNIYNPVKDLFVCNESWSPEQGWVEGALIMSDFVMVKGFKLKPFAVDSIAKLIPTP